MIASDLLQEIRMVIFDTEEPFLWDDNELLTYLKDTINEIYVMTDFKRTDKTLSTQPTIYSYPINGYTNKVWNANTYLIETDYTSFMANLGSVSGEPTTFSTNSGNLYLYPIPDDVYSLTYIHIPQLFSISYDTILPIDDYELLKYGVFFRAYLKQDTEIFDEKTFIKFQQLYVNKLNMFKSKYVRDTNITYSYIHKGLL